MPFLAAATHLPEHLTDMPIDILLNFLLGRTDSILDRPSTRPSMSNNPDPIKAEQGSTSILSIVETPISFSERTTTHEISQFTGKIFLKSFLQYVSRETRNTFHSLQGYIAGKPIADDHIDLAIENIPSFDIANVIQRGRYKLLARRPGEIVSLSFLLAVASDPDARTGNPLHFLSIDRAHKSKLNQMMRFAVYVSTGVDYYCPLRQTRHDDQNRGSSYLRQPAHDKHPRRHHGTGIPRAHHSLNFSAFHHLKGDPHR